MHSLAILQGALAPEKNMTEELRVAFDALGVS